MKSAAAAAAAAFCHLTFSLSIYTRIVKGRCVWPLPLPLQYFAIYTLRWALTKQPRKLKHVTKSNGINWRINDIVHIEHSGVSSYHTVADFCFFITQTHTFHWLKSVQATAAAATPTILLVSCLFIYIFYLRTCIGLFCLSITEDRVCLWQKLLGKLEKLFFLLHYLTHTHKLMYMGSIIYSWTIEPMLNRHGIIYHSRLWHGMNASNTHTSTM